MSNASAFFDGFKGALLASLNTSMPCKVLQYDATTCTAKIQPLFKSFTSDNYILLQTKSQSCQF